MMDESNFIINKEGQTLQKRFGELIKDSKAFDCLVGFFYASGFSSIYKSLESTKEIRILIGISTNRQTYKLIKEADQQKLSKYSHVEAKEEFSEDIQKEYENAPDTKEVDEGSKKFIEWIKSKKLQIRVYPSERIHAKIYIITFKEGDREPGRVITGSSNFTEAGLIDNLEFNVELKDNRDYNFALKKFNELWEDSIDVSEKYVETVEKKTWLNDTLKPYELYLKFLYEYFKEKINRDLEEIYKDKQYLPENFLDLEYQQEAVKDVKSKLEEYGGVFIADVVGLGKTYISAMLTQQLTGRTLVIAPPNLLDENNPGSWKNVFSDFRIAADFESVGKLTNLLRRGTEKYDNIIIDEAHRFRTETNITYEDMARICRGKKVILVSATPLNNSPKDILSQIKLFQKSKNSTIPNLRNLELFFNKLDKRLIGLDRQTNNEEYIRIVKENAKIIRENVLKYLMVRRTRREVENYFGDDLKKQGLKFPDVEDPEPVFYEFNKHEDEVFNETLKLINKKLRYARYRSMSYYTKPTDWTGAAKENMGKLMKILLIKRLESSFYAFNKTIGRFIESYDKFIKAYDKGKVYVSKKYINKIFQYLESGDDESIQRLIEEDKAEEYDTKDFRNDFINDLKKDLEILNDIKKLWKTIKRDPKLKKFKEILSTKKILKKNKLIVFTESKETAEYLKEPLEKYLNENVLIFYGTGAKSYMREKVIDNFDARAKHKKDDYRILISTEVLSEGVNLHRSNVVINYDIPWNPTRLMQRVGRINRVDTTFENIYTLNFFPTTQSDTEIKLKAAAQYKINAFIEMLGADARLLTEGEEIKSHDLFNRLNSKKTILGDEETGGVSELRYLKIIRDIRDKEPELFARVKKMPKKARTAKNYEKDALLTYFRKGKLQKFFISSDDLCEELDFFSAAELLSCDKDCKRLKIGENFYKLLEKNKEEFKKATTEELIEHVSKRGRDNAAIILRILKSKQIREFSGFTDEDELYIKAVMDLLEEGALPKQTLKVIVQQIKKEKNPLRILVKIRVTLPKEFFKETAVESSAQTFGPREVILSEYLVRG